MTSEGSLLQVEVKKVIKLERARSLISLMTAYYDIDYRSGFKKILHSHTVVHVFFKMSMPKLIL